MISSSRKLFGNVVLGKSLVSTPVFFAGKELSFGQECRQQMLRGCDKLADAVQTTLGPKGRNVVIDQPYGGPKITKDGVTVAKAIEFSNRFENIGAQLVKSVASKANDEAGDGTTTATVLARAIFKEGVKSVAAGLNPMDLRRGINLACEAVVKDLKSRSKPVKSKDMIENVATISANGDVEIGKLIAELMDKVGEHGTITVSDGKTLNHEIEFVEGMKFDRGYISPYFATDPKTQKTEFEKPYILITDKKISNIQSILQILEHVVRENKPLLLIADDVESEALAQLVLNKQRGGLKVCAVKAPAFGDNRKAILNDIAVLTGATVVTEDVGLTLEKSDHTVLGQCKSIIVTKDDTIIMDGIGSKESIAERCEIIKAQVTESNSEYDKDKLKERLAKLQGGVGVIKVGGASEVEVGEIKDRITDALNATRAAVDEGIVVGGGCALLYATRVLDKLKGDNFDQNIGIQIVKKAIELPCRTIVENAGEEGAVVVGKLLEGKDEEFGYDASKSQYVNMIKAGIIDPTKVVRTALVDAASGASLMTTTECMIVEGKKEEKAGGAPNMGGMGGMEGMY
uniref:Hsp60, putative n=1 Tax=Paramecium tetraurelia TaxID=5888 RepID=Q3SEA5_PARTE|nr:hsp60, putative [Paramecium tetraurelia]